MGPKPLSISGERVDVMKSALQTRAMASDVVREQLAAAASPQNRSETYQYGHSASAYRDTLTGGAPLVEGAA